MYRYPLMQMASLLQQKVRLRAGFDTFGDHLKIQHLAHRDDGRYHRRVAGITRQILDKGAIYFEDVDRETFQVCKRRLAGAKIVDGQAHSHRAQLSQHARRHGKILHQAALGNFEFQ